MKKAKGGDRPCRRGLIGSCSDARGLAGQSGQPRRFPGSTARFTPEDMEKGRTWRRGGHGAGHALHATRRYSIVDPSVPLERSAVQSRAVSYQSSSAGVPISAYRVARTRRPSASAT